MTNEFHYPRGTWSELRRQLPDKWIPLNDFLSKHRPKNVKEQKWEALDFDDDSSRKALFLWKDSKTRQRVSTRKADDIRGISARELFLERMRREMPRWIQWRKEGFFASAGKVAAEVAKSKKQFEDTLALTSGLPRYFRSEFDEALLTKLERTLRSLIAQETGPHQKLPRNLFRRDFLDLVVEVYTEIYDRPPRRTKERKSGAGGFPEVAGKLCKFAGFHSTGVEDQLLNRNTRQISPKVRK